MGMTRLLILAIILLSTLAAGAQSPAPRASGLGVNISLLARLVGGGNTLFVSTIDVTNHATATREGSGLRRFSRPGRRWDEAFARGTESRACRAATQRNSFVRVLALIEPTANEQSERPAPASGGWL